MTLFIIGNDLFVPTYLGAEDTSPRIKTMKWNVFLPTHWGLVHYENMPILVY